MEPVSFDDLKNVGMIIYTISINGHTSYVQKLLFDLVKVWLEDQKVLKSVKTGSVIRPVDKKKSNRKKTKFLDD